MAGVFSTYLQLGFEHIADLNGYDHILFLVALCAVYQGHDWKKVAVLVTAFTVGHSLTLALAALDIFEVSSPLVEFLIPVTIFATSLGNTHPSALDSSAAGGFSKAMVFRYVSALFFGLIHGLGFSNFFRQMTLPGQENGLIAQLFAFNVGVEVGQLLIVGLILSLTWLSSLRISARSWNIFISGAAAGISLLLMLERFPT